MDIQGFFSIFTNMILALLTDIHEDLVSLKAALHKIDSLKVDHIACLGDMVGFSVPYHDFQETRNAHECIALIRSNCKYVVLGNHDMHAAQILPKHSDVFDFPTNWYELDYERKKELCSDQIWLPELNELNPLLTTEDKEYLRSLPEYILIEEGETKLLLSHYLYPNLSGLHKGFYFDKTETQKHLEFIKNMGAQFSFVGHEHFDNPWQAKEHNGQLQDVKKGLFSNFSKTITFTHPTDVHCIGVSPLVKKSKNGFCIFDTEKRELKYFPL